MAVNVNHVPLEEGEDPYLTLSFGAEGETVSVTLTATFEGEWKAYALQGDVTERQAREAFAADVFDLVYREFVGGTIEESLQAETA